jgi:hypothetical protein
LYIWQLLLTKLYLKMKKHLFFLKMLMILTFTGFLSSVTFQSFAQSTTATYTAGALNVNTPDYSASCGGAINTLTVSVPPGALVSSVDVSYTITSQGGAWTNEQRSRLRCVSTGNQENGPSAGFFACNSAGSGGTGSCTSSAGTTNYTRTGLTIANGFSASGNIEFALDVYGTWPSGGGCNQTYHSIPNSSWIVTVFYTVPNDCAGTPNAGTATISSSAGCPNTNFTLTATGLSAEQGISYQWQSASSAGGPWTNIPGATSSTLITNTASTAFYKLVSTCSFGGATNETNVVSYTAAGSPCECGVYSANYPTSAADTEISSVTVGSMSNNLNTCSVAASGPGSIAGRYSNFTTSVTGPSEIQGSTVSYNVIQNSCSGTQYTNVIQIYVDWDQNGIFDISEMVAESTAGTNVSPGFSGTFTVPLGALLGTTRMRVVCAETTVTGLNYAQSAAITWGETEDYCFTVLAASPCVGTPAPGNTVASVTTGCSGTNTTLSFSTPVNGSGITYQWQSASSSSGPWTDIIGATNPTFSTTITADTWYQCVVTCTEPGGSSGTSTPIEVTVLPANLCPCYPTMFPTNPCNYIDVVTTTGANVDISTNVSSGYNSNIGPGISLFTNTGLTVTAGTSFNLNVQAQGFCDIAYFSVWIDFNQNGVFESSEFLVNSVSTGNTPTTFNLAVPVDALGGFTLMRIIAWGNTPNTDPCGLLSAFYGEHEDFLMEIVQASDCAGTPDAGSATISASTGCVASPFTLTATGVSFGNGISYQWESALDAAGPWTPIAGATSLTLNTSGPSVTTFYRLVTTCSFGGATNITNTVSYIPTNCCNYTFVLTDSFGDGWNGATMDVLEGATVITTLGPTFLTGTSLSISVPIVDGSSYSLFYSNGGSWAAEVGIQIINPFGETIFTLPAGAGAIGTTLFTWTGNCTPPPANPTSITASNTLLCSNDLGEVTLTANGAVGTVHWFTTGCNTTGWFATGNSITVNPSSTTTYFARNLEGTQWSLGCASVTVEVNTAPTANAGIDDVLCAGNSLQLNGTFTAVPETQVLNIDQNVNNTCMATFSQGDLAQSFTATTNTSCGAGLTFTAPAFGDLTISLWTNLPNAGGVQLATATSTISGSSTGDVTWPSVSLTPGTTYFLVFQSSSIFECIAGATTNPYAGGILYANTGYTPFVNFDYTFRTFSCTGGGVNTTEWFGNNIVSGSNTLTPTVAPTSTSTYDFVVTNLNNGCSASSSVTITVNNPVSSVDFVVAPAPFTWIDGNTYFADNNTATFTFVGGAANGCDSTVTLNFTVLLAGPENDFPCDAFDVVSSGVTSLNTFAFLSGMNCNNQTGNNTTANPDANGVPCAGTLGRSLWYTFTTPLCDVNGTVPFEIELSTNNAGTNFDTKVYLFSSPTSTCGDLVQVACNNDHNGAGYPALCDAGDASASTIVATSLLPNTQYWIKVDGLNMSNVGDFVLSGRAIAAPHAVAVVGGGTQLQLSTTNMGAGLYTYYYRQVGSSGYSVSNSATSLTDVRTLSPNVSYETQIMYRCDASSNFNQSQFYRTEPQTTLLQSSCALVNDMTCTFNGPNSYTLTWTEPAGELFTNNGQLSGYRVKRNPIGSTSVFTFGNPAVVCSNGVCSVTLPGNSPTGFNWTIETRCSATNIQVGNTSSCTPQAPEFSGNNNNLSSLANKSMQHAFSFVNAQAGIEFVDVQMYDAYADFGLNTPMMGDYEIFVNDNNEISWRRMDTPVDANFDFVIVPNPSNAMTTVFLNTIVEEGSFTIVDAMGRTIQTGSINNTDNVNFDAAQLQSGVYLVVVTIDNQKMTRRLVVAD